MFQIRQPLLGLIMSVITFSLPAQGLTGPEADAKAKDILSKMTLRQKVYEMHGHELARLALSAIFTQKITPVIAGGNKRLGIPPTIFYDGPRGIFRYKGATAFPVTMARGASWDPGLERRVGEAMGEEVRCLGGNYSGATCMNLLRNPRWGRSQETYGEDPYHIGEMGSSLVEGIQSKNVQACVKHFAANSMENNRYGGNINMDERTLREVYLPHFKKVIQRGAASVMSAYNKLNGEFCGQNRHLLTDILRTDWGFKGYITSDWAQGLLDGEKGIKAGLNVEMPGGKRYKLSKVKRLLHQGKVTEQQIDDLVLPVIRTKLIFASRPDTQAYPKSLLGCDKHIALAREVAEKSAVLLKNENNILPLDKAKIKRIAVIGSLAHVKQTGDRGSSTVTPSYIIDPLDGIRAYFKGTNTQVLYAAPGDTQAIRAICTGADAVIVAAGMTYRDEGEYIGFGKIRDRNNPNKKSAVNTIFRLALGGDRKYLHLHEADINTIHLAASVSRNVIVCLTAGSAVTVEEWHSEVPAILETFYNGMEGGNALANILFGAVNPSGKLPFTVPVSESDMTPFDSYAGNVDYGYYHGYTLFDKQKKVPRYPFGFGLSYTSFSISGLKTDKAAITPDDSMHISVKIKNTGVRAGAEVVQMYVGFGQAPVDMPKKLLRGFQKIYLQPGEESMVDFTLPASAIAYYDTNNKKWQTLKGNFSILVGNSSDEKNMLTAGISIK